MNSKSNYKNWYYNNHDKAKTYKANNMKKYRAANPEKYRRQSREAKARLKEKIFEIYGHSCVVCGFTDKRALTLDHVLNNGAEERKVLSERGVYYRALQPEFVREYQILCMNCQFIKRVEAKRQNQHG